jgi:hypothetical protein
MSESKSNRFDVLDEEFQSILKSPLLQRLLDGDPLDEETGPLYVRLCEVVSAIASIADHRRVDPTPVKHFRDLVSDLVAGATSVSAQELNAAALRASNLVRDLTYGPQPEEIPRFARRHIEAPANDFDFLAETLLRSGQALPSKLVRFMKDHSTATFQEVMDQVHGGERTEGAIRSLVNRTNNLLRDQKSLLSFSTKRCQVIRHIASE